VAKGENLWELENYGFCYSFSEIYNKISLFWKSIINSLGILQNIKPLILKAAEI
jgi:hypothetical protein